jgi:hypothetical protein
MSDTIKIDCYPVGFDDEGATSASSIPRACYRVNAVTATNAVDLMKYHRALCFAMMNSHPEELAAYRIAAGSAT